MKGYGGLPKEYSTLQSSKIVVLPVPFDGTSTWIKGADKGPEAIITASQNMELYDIETDQEVFRKGIATAPALEGESTPEAIYKKTILRTKDLINSGKFVVGIGGEHSVSIGMIKAHVDKYDNISVLQFDAHTDLRPEYEGSKYNHACVMARVAEMAPFVQVGIRSMDVEEKKYINKERLFLAEEIYHHVNWFDSVISKLDDNVYITFDLDVFDPSILPSTGTPEPGGLLYYPVLKFLKLLAKQRNIVGFDVVELCPNPADKSSDFLAAKLIYKLLSYIFNSD